MHPSTANHARPLHAARCCRERKERERERERARERAFAALRPISGLGFRVSYSVLLHAEAFGNWLGCGGKDRAGCESFPTLYIASRLSPEP